MALKRAFLPVLWGDSETELPPGVLACTHWERQGCTIGFGDHRIASFDKGRTWWDIGQDGGTVTPANPAFLRQLGAFDAVVRLAEEHPRFAPSSSAPDNRKVYRAGGGRHPPVRS